MCHAPRQPHMRLGDLAAVRQAALAGAGLAQLPGWFVAEDVQAGCLVPLLLAWQPEPLPIHLLWLKTTRMTARLRLVIDALLNTLGPPQA
ncbi:LysR substrate-binding domain-containing protein [Kerstersia gyiorum]|uniref:LysR substrate-binding domain-containing protein n=1 Tax=Kerstersia gyiorum TaxID=206506 RepID=UPI0030D5BEC1